MDPEYMIVRIVVRALVLALVQVPNLVPNLVPVRVIRGRKFVPARDLCVFAAPVQVTDGLPVPDMDGQ